MSDESPQGGLAGENPTGRFSDRAADYVKYRPGYPAAAIDAVLAGLAEPAKLVAVDIGAGTGISSRLLAERGVRVIGVEPNAAMREAAEQHERVEMRGGTAEATGLGDASVDLVLCAQAFHWFRQNEALAEFARVLKPGGRVALVWNDRDNDDPLTGGYNRAILAASENHPAARRFPRPEVLFESKLFAQARERPFAYTQDLNEAGLIGRATSASYVPKSGVAYERLVRELRSLFHTHADASAHVRMAYRTNVYLAERV
ncbi:MAG: class I SAM-dependent methyltransferase [Phycisphaerales bacterium]